MWSKLYMPASARYWIEKLQLRPHIEGGYFSEIYRSALVLQQQQLSAAISGNRNASTAIYFLLEQGRFSAFHRIASDELWHFYAGDPLEVFELHNDGTLTIHQLGSDPEQGQHFHCIIQAGNWFASAPKAGSAYSLCGCTVAPGFHYEDFELAGRASLLHAFPQHAALITRLTK